MNVQAYPATVELTYAEKVKKDYFTIKELIKTLCNDPSSELEREVENKVWNKVGDKILPRYKELNNHGRG